MKHTKNYHKDYPRVQFFRDSYRNLNGIWDFGLDYDNKGLELGFENSFIPTHEILVPFSYNCKYSLVNVEQRCDIQGSFRRL